MKFAFASPLLDLSGNVLHDDAGNAIALKTLIVQALLVGDKESVAADKFYRYLLAAKVHSGEDIDITEAALIKSAVGSVLMPLPVGRIWELLEHPLPESAT